MGVPMTTLIDTDDAMIWAEEFCRIFDGHTIVAKPTNLPQGTVDAGNMVSWFANAMQTAVRQSQNRANVTVHQDEDGTITILDDLPLNVYISSELLMTMIDQHNRSVRKNDG